MCRPTRWPCLLALGLLPLFFVGCDQLRPPSPVAVPTPVAGARLYVVDHERGLMALEPHELRLREQLPMAGGAARLVLAPHGATLYASADQAGQVVALSPQGEVCFRIGVGASPQGIALARTASVAWVANQESQDISILDLAARREVRRVPCVGQPHDLVLSASETLLWVSLQGSGEVALLEAASGREVRRARVGMSPYRMALDEAAGLLYVTLFDQGEVAVLDARTLKEKHRFKTEEGPFAVLLDGRGGVLVTNLEGGSITWLRGGASKEPLHMAVGPRPRGLALSPDGREVFVAVEGENRLSVRSLDDLREQRSVPLATPPMDVCFSN